MKHLFRYITFLLGLITILISYLFFSGQELLYAAFLVSGFAFALISFIAILYYDKSEVKIIWSILAVAFIIIRPQVKPWLISKSFRIALRENQELFDQTNVILISKKGEVAYPPISKSDSVFAGDEILTLNQLRKKAGVNYIRKDDTKIYYVTYGDMDNDGGLFYFYSGIIPTHHFVHVNGKWYYD